MCAVFYDSIMQSHKGFQALHRVSEQQWKVLHDVVETYNELWLTYFGDFFLAAPLHTVSNLHLLYKNSTIEKNCIEMNMNFKTQFDHNFE